MQAARGRNMAHVAPCVLQFAGKMTQEDLQVHLTAEEHAAYGATSSPVITGTAQVLTTEAAGLQSSDQTLHTLTADTPVITHTIQVTEALTNVIQSGISTISPS